MKFLLKHKMSFLGLIIVTFLTFVGLQEEENFVHDEIPVSNVINKGPTDPIH